MELYGQRGNVSALKKKDTIASVFQWEKLQNGSLCSLRSEKGPLIWIRAVEKPSQIQWCLSAEKNVDDSRALSSLKNASIANTGT